MLFKTTFALTTVAVSLGAAAQADDHVTLRGYALAADGGTLVTMADLTQPGAVETYALATPLLDAGADTLGTLASNAGELASVGKLSLDGATVDVSDWGGFDIVSPEEGTDMAYAILQIEGAETAGLYSVDLGSGALTQMADLGMGGFTGFAVAQAQ